MRWWVSIVIGFFSATLQMLPSALRHNATVRVDFMYVRSLNREAVVTLAGEKNVKPAPTVVCFTLHVLPHV